ncbi:MAG: ABC transporter permease [Vicinamibacterales bacterium]
MTAPQIPRPAVRLIGAAAWLVPAAMRDDWQREWHGELAAWVADGRRGAVRHAAGAVADAFWIRQRQLGDVGWLDDVRHGWRQLREQIAFAVVAVGILAVGMAASIAAYSVVSQILLRPLPYPEPERVVTLWERQPSEPNRLDVAPANFLDWRSRAASFSALAAAEPYSRDYSDAERPEVWPMLNVTAGFFEALGTPPLLGRTFTPDEPARGRAQVLVISAGLWRSRFAADPAIVGRRITLDAEPWTIVGVMPDDFLPMLMDATPGARLAWAPKHIEEFELRIRASGYWNVVGRLRPGVTLAQAADEMDRLAAQIAAEQPRTNRGSRVEVVPIREHLVGDIRAAVGLFAAAVGVVLLIACVNVTNLLLARGATRATELAVRSALGASRWRLVGQLLVESLLLAGLAAVVALGLADGVVRALARFGPAEVPWVGTLHLDWRAAAFAAALSAAVAMLAGLVPALRLSGVGAGATRTATGDRGHRRLRSTLVAAEVALALVLVSGAALLLKSFVNLVNVEAGFARDGVAVLQMFAWDRNPGPDRLRTFFDAAIGRIAALPGVEAAGAVMAMPFIESNIDVRAPFQIVGDPVPAPGEEPRASFNVATPGYFPALGVTVVRGRGLDERDGRDGAAVAVISEALAERYWRGRDPIGRRLVYRSQGRSVTVEIVGVVASVRHERLDAPPRLEVFRPFAQAPTGSMTVVARTRLGAPALLESAKHQVWAVDPLQAFHRMATLEDLVSRTVSARRFALVVLAGFAALALLLAAAGLYGVLTAIALQYRREIGVRMAIGATWTDIVRLMLGRGLAVVAVGVAAGVAGSLGTGRLLTSFLFSVSPVDPWAIGGAALLLTLVALPACLVPARRAAGTSPSEVLRAE